MIEVPGHEVIRALRVVDGRSVFQTRREGVDSVTRVLTRTRLPAHFAQSVHSAALSGKGSFAALGDDVAMTLDGYSTAARLLGKAGEPPRWTWVLDAGLTAAGHVFITTAWVDGTPLHQLERELSDTEARAIVLGLLRTLCDLHACRVAYGDLKLANIVLRPDGAVTLIDLDTLREVSGPDTGAPTRDRSEAWAAPEQITQQETWLSSDLFALARVANEVFRKMVPEVWAQALWHCRHRDPRRRPSASSLLAVLTGAATHLVDHTGASLETAPSDPIPFDQPTVVEPQPTGDETEREPSVHGQLPAGDATEREDAPFNVAERAPASAEVRPAPDVRPAPSGCFGIVAAVGQFAFFGALFGFAVLGLGFFAYNLAQKNAADAMAEAVLARVKIHKTDPARNTDAEQERVAKAAAEAWEKAHTPRTCAVRALTLIWKQHWHYDAEWSPTDFTTALSAVDDPLCAGQPEATLARATLFAGACKRRDPTVPTVEDCTSAIVASSTFWSQVPAGDVWDWMRIEAAWQELRARNALAARFVETKNAEAEAQLSGSLALCDKAFAQWLDFAPVNGVYVVRQCATAAGLAYDVKRYIAYSERRLSALPTDTADRRRIISQLYASAGPDCAGTTLTWRKSGVVVEGAPWCRALGDLARHCPDEVASLIVENSPGDTVHPWSDLSAAARQTSGTCLQ